MSLTIKAVAVRCTDGFVARGFFKLELPDVVELADCLRPQDGTLTAVGFTDEVRKLAALDGQLELWSAAKTESGVLAYIPWMAPRLTARETTVLDSGEVVMDVHLDLDPDHQLIPMLCLTWFQGGSGGLP